MMIKNITGVLVICLTACVNVNACPTSIDGWTMYYEPDVDVLVPGINF